MYKVFLVEDEIVVREGIRNNIPWEKTPFMLVGEAPDGEMALSIIKDIKPDILITDIRMPFMDGLCLSRIVKKTLPWIKIIILSGHDEFDYAREAISIGIEEYLLKPVSSRDMLGALEKIARRIDEEKEKLLSIEHLKAVVQSHSDVLRDQWLCDFINGKIPMTNALEKARELGLDLIARSYITAVIGIYLVNGNSSRNDSPHHSPDSRLLQVNMIIRSITEKYPNVILFRKDERKQVVLIKGSFQNGERAERSYSMKLNDLPGSLDTAESIEDSVYSIVQAIKYEAERNTECKIAAGIGACVERIGEIGKSYFRAEQILNHQSALGLFQISDGADLNFDDGVFDGTGLLNVDRDILQARFRYASKKDIDGIIGEYAHLFNDDENQMLKYFILGEIIVAASKVLEELGGAVKELIPFSLNQYEMQKTIASWEIFYGRIHALFDAVLEFRNSRVEGRYRSVILKAKEYIDANYREEDISLHTVASHVGISPNHLSTVFAQETGENFIEYLTGIRIEKAKHLLTNTTMKSADIAGETGFSDPHYFSFIFKKNTGVSPREYRSRKK
ncbi:MAG: response regulator [Treponema sp.]|jgi:two-component system response regulator YesN|nr:response regulator [Treponema sp.]